MSSNNNNGNGGGPPEENPGLGQQKRADPTEVVSRAKSQRDSVQSKLRSAADWFHDYYDNEGDLLSRGEAITKVEQHLGVERNVAARIIANLIGDLVDPITQINTFDGKFVGILDYNEGDIYYSYTEYDDAVGEREVVVCAQCVHEHTREENVVHAKEYSGSFESASHAELVQAVRDHFDNAHDVEPEDVETGATLLSGTTIAGNEAWHAGNDGSGSGLDADNVKGNDIDSDGDGSVDQADDSDTVDGFEGAALNQQVDMFYASNTSVEQGSSSTTTMYNAPSRGAVVTSIILSVSGSDSGGYTNTVRINFSGGGSSTVSISDSGANDQTQEFTAADFGSGSNGRISSVDHETQEGGSASSTTLTAEIAGVELN